MPPAACPYCDKMLDAADSYRDGITPKPGDVTVCIYCAQASFFTTTLHLRRPETGELEKAVKSNPQLSLIMEIVRGLDRRNPRG